MACPLCVTRAQRPATMARLPGEQQAHAALVMGWLLARAAKDENLCPKHRDACQRMQGQVDAMLDLAGLPRKLIVLA